MQGITFDPIIPLWMLGLIVGLGVLAVLWSYFRNGLLREQPISGWGMVLLKIGVLLAVAAMIAKPVLRKEEERKEKAGLLVMVDYSESMNIRDESGNQTRFKKAAELIDRRWADDLEGRYAVNFYEFSSFLRPVERKELVFRKKAGGAATDIGGAIRQAIRGEGARAPAAIILLSDGVHNTGLHPEDAMSFLEGLDIPLFTVGLGGDQIYQDVEFNEVIIPELVFENEKVNIGLDLTAYGYQGKKATVRLLLNGITETGVKLSSDQIDVKELARQEVELLGQGFRQRVNFEYQPEKVGDYHLVLEAAPLEGESVRSNNQVRDILTVAKKQINVLILEGRPRWETTMLARSLRRDPRFKLDVLYLLTPRENIFYPMGTGFMDKWGKNYNQRFSPLDPPYAEYDCIVLGDLDSGLFQSGSLSRLAEQVNKEGKALIFLPGENGIGDGQWWKTALNPLIPVEPDLMGGALSREVQYQLTAQGMLHPLTNVLDQPQASQEVWKSLPEGFEYYPAGGLRPGGVSLVENSAAEGNPPLLVFQRVGKGRILALLFDQTWLWALSPEDLIRKNRIHTQFWRGAVRYTVTGAIETGETGIHLKVDKEQVSRGESLEVQVRVFDQMGAGRSEVELELLSPDGLSRNLTLVPESGGERQKQNVRHFSSQIRSEQVGEYQLSARMIQEGEVVDESTASFTSELTAFEYRNAGLNEQLLQSLARRSKGGYYNSEEAVKLPDDLPSSERIIREIRRTELWNSFVLFLILAVLLKSEWIVRKWMDLN